MIYANLDSLNIKTRIGGLLFDIILDKRFFVHDMDNAVHKHKHTVYEFHCIVDGEGTVHINNNEYKVKPGCYFVVNAGVYHKQLQDENNPIHKYCFKFEYKYRPHLADNFFPDEESRKIAGILDRLEYYIAGCEGDTGAMNDRTDNSGKMITLIHGIQEELLTREIGFYARVQCLFTQLFIFMARDMNSEKETTYSIPRKLPYEKRSALIEDFFDRHFNDNVTSNDLCSILNLSTSQLNRILKRKYNSTFGQKLLEMRIEAAKKHLETTDMPVNEIAEKVGYSTPSHFCNIFKKKCGITPGEYRAMKQTSKYSFE